MLSDRDRTEAFKNAINYAVKPGAVVLELGGGTGILSFLAAQNARKVYCVELNLDLVDEARRVLQLERNENGNKVEVIHADASEYVPPEPVDAVICEMLHVGLLREKQLQVINAFKSRYKEKYADAPMPVFIPEAVIQAVQPVWHDFTFEGYYAPIVMFQSAYDINYQTLELGEPAIYHSMFYDEPFELSCHWSGVINITAEGTLNALRIATKNILALLPELEQGMSIDWYNQYLILPLEREFSVEPGQRLEISIDYLTGEPLSALRPIVNIANN